MSGYQLMIVDEIFRGRFAELEQPARLSQQRQRIRIDLHSGNHCVERPPGYGAACRVLVPVYDRNPQKFVANIFTAQTV